MEVLKFVLSGRTAFFKKPEVNSYFYFTYGNIHKVALLGMFGAILGYSGYGKAFADGKGNLKFEGNKELPEFYTKLSCLKIGIIPNHKKGYIQKKVQTFNNSVGYASKEQGGNLIVKEQWLENPSWTIYVLLDHKESFNLRDALMENSCVYLPYLGKNDHLANITDVMILSGKEPEKINILDSLFAESAATFENEEDESEDTPFKYAESLPVSLDAKSFMYTLEKMAFTNIPVKEYKGIIYEIKDINSTRNIAFY